MFNITYLVCLGLFASVVASEILNDDSHLLVIQEDVIPDVENTTQKVIRVSPLDLPAVGEDKEKKEDSDLYKIKSIHPYMPRKYMNSKRMRKFRPQMLTPEHADRHIVITRSSPNAPKFEKGKQRKKHLRFLYDQPQLDGKAITKSMRVKIAPGAYPVYYTVAKVNGKFGKFPIKSFRTPTEFMKYLLRSKSEKIDLSQRYESA